LLNAAADLTAEEALVEVVAAFTVAEAAVSTQEAEASAVASAVDPPRHHAWVQARRAPRQVRRCDPVVGQIFDPEGVDFDPPAAR
jgi:hypothetical protein